MAQYRLRTFSLTVTQSVHMAAPSYSITGFFEPSPKACRPRYLGSVSPIHTPISQQDKLIAPLPTANESSINGPPLKNSLWHRVLRISYSRPLAVDFKDKCSVPCLSHRAPSCDFAYRLLTAVYQNLPATKLIQLILPASETGIYGFPHSGLRILLEHCELLEVPFEVHQALLERYLKEDDVVDGGHVMFLTVMESEP